MWFWAWILNFCGIMMNPLSSSPLKTKIRVLTYLWPLPSFRSPTETNRYAVHVLGSSSVKNAVIKIHGCLGRLRTPMSPSITIKKLKRGLPCGSGLCTPPNCAPERWVSKLATPWANATALKARPYAFHGAFVHLSSKPKEWLDNSPYV